MSMDLMLTGLFIVSVATNLTVEGIKALMSKSDKQYSADVLAVIVSVILSIALSAGYMILNDVVFTLKIGVQIVLMMYLSFLVATVGYDKVIQMFKPTTKTK